MRGGQSRGCLERRHPELERLGVIAAHLPRPEGSLAHLETRVHRDTSVHHGKTQTSTVQEIYDKLIKYTRDPALRERED